MKKILSVTALILSVITAGCSDSTPVDVKIANIGEVEEVLSVQALTGDGKVHLSWQIPSDAIGVNIRRSTTGFPFAVVDGESIYSGPATEFVDESVLIGKRYYYLIVAIDENLNFAGGVKTSSFVYDYGICNYLNEYSISFFDIAVDSDYIYSVGSIDSNEDNPDLIIEKRNKLTGLLDTSFGINGSIINSISQYEDEFISIATDSDYIYMAGTDCSLDINDSQWRIEKRRKDTGALVSTFGSSGIIQSNPSSVLDYFVSVAIDDDYIYAAGYYGMSDTQWRIEKRRKDTGVLVETFGSSGIILSNPSPYADALFTISIDNEYIYAGGNDFSASTMGDNSQWRIEKRRKDTGALVSTFGSSGIIQSDPSSSHFEYLKTLIIDDDYIYSGGIDYPSASSNRQWRIEKRRKDNGALVTSFGSSGIIQLDFSSADDHLRSLIIDNDYIYAAGTDSSSSFMVKFSKSDGSIITTFGNSEYKLITPYEVNKIYKILLNNNYIYAVGSSYDDNVLNTHAGITLLIDPLTGLLRTGSLVEME